MKTIFIIFLSSISIKAQLVASNVQNFIINNGALVIVNGGVEIYTGSMINDGFLQVTKNSNLNNPGNFKINQFVNISGNGYYKIEQDWINNGLFNCNQSTVELYGDMKQFISSSLNVSTTFHDLILSGNGVNENRKKELDGVNSSTDFTGTLVLNDRELSTLINSFYVLNPINNCVYFDQTFQDEGFVSSLSPGFLWRSTNNNSTYIFPVGSSNGVKRFRPIVLNPKLQNNNQFGVRLNNYDADSDLYSRDLTDGLSKDLNPYFYHSIEGTDPSASIVELKIGYLGSDGIFNGIANWNQNNWKSFLNEVPSSIGNYISLSQNEIDLYSLFHPFILANTDLSSDVYVPNTFTPDGQEFNNIFSPVFSNINLYSEIELYIYNRWGELIHVGYGLECGWDGYYNFSICQDGVYTWKLNYHKGGVNITLVGHVNLIK